MNIDRTCSFYEFVLKLHLEKPISSIWKCFVEPYNLDEGARNKGGPT